MPEIMSFEDIKAKCTDLEGRYSELRQMFAKIDDAFLLRWASPPPNEIAKQFQTSSPNARNVVVGQTRLLKSAEPQFSVPVEETDLKSMEKSEDIEQICKVIWSASNKLAPFPTHYTAYDSAVLYGEVQIAIHSTKAMLEASKTNSDIASVKRMERIAKATPVFFEVMDPKSGYPEYDRFGLKSYYRKVEMYTGDILDIHGEAALMSLGSDARSNLVNYCDYLDDAIHVTWIEGKGPLTEDKNWEHGLPRIPIVCQITEGSSLFVKPEERQTPMLYTIIKSGLLERQHLSLSTIYYLVFNLGTSPLFIYEGADEDMQVDFSVPGGVIRVRNGKLNMLDKRQILDRSLMAGWELSDQLGEQSTMYKQTMGQPVGGGNAPFAAISLLNSSGRQVLITPKDSCEHAFGVAMETALGIIRQDGGGKAKGKDRSMTIKASDIPEDVSLSCKIEVDLPQDKLQLANIAQMIKQSGLMPDRWIRETLLSAGQSDKLDKEIWSERAAQAMYQATMQQQMQQMMQAQQQQQAQGMPQPGGPGPGMPPGMPPGGPGPEGMVPPSAPTQRPTPGGEPPVGLPPTMAGMLPPSGANPAEGGMV